MHDVCVLNNTLNLKNKVFEFLINKYFFRNIRYFNCKYFLMLYKNTKYHLKE